MLYEKYRQKTLKRASILATIKRFRVLFILIALLVLSSSAILMGIAGLVIQDGVCPTQITYGEKAEYTSGAIFHSVWYEYSDMNGEEWTTQAPTQVGSYKVRSVSYSIFGSHRYGKVQTFTILPRNITVSVAENKITYGNTPTVEADVQYQDIITCADFVYDDISQITTGIEPVEDSIRITDQNGNDVSSNYSVNVSKKQVDFIKREIDVLVGSTNREYNGLPLTFDQYQVSSETPLAWDDQEIAVFTASITNAGQTENTPEIRIVNNGQDVTVNYDINILSGLLTVDRRVVLITSASTQTPFTYDGEEHSLGLFEHFQITDGTLVENHTISVDEFAVVKNVGKVDNVMSFTFADGEGEDVTDNYSVILTVGTLEVIGRPITVEIEDAEQVYNGLTLTSNTYRITSDLSVVDGQELVLTYVGGQTNVGTSVATVDKEKTVIYDGEDDVTSNYLITYVDGSLNVTKRPITFCTGVSSWVYDGQEHTYDNHWVMENLELTDYGLVNVEGVVPHTYLTSGWTVVKNVMFDDQDQVTTTQNEMHFTIYQGKEDVTNNYQITYNFGTLEVTQRPIGLISSSYKVYDGLIFEYNGLGLTKGELVAGQTVWANTSHKTYEGNPYAYFDVGTYDNIIERESIVITDGVDDLTKNYLIDLEVGSLEIAKREIILFAGSAQAVYSDTVLKEETIYSNTIVEEYQGVSLVLDHEATAEFSYPDYAINEFAYIDVGVWTNRIDQSTLSIKGADEVEKKQNYEIIFADGELIIDLRPITFITLDQTFTYNDQAFSYSGHQVKEGSLAEYDGQPHQTEAINLATRTEWGTTQNTMEVLIYRNAMTREVTHNYQIDYDYAGVITVDKRPISIWTGSQNWLYSDLQFTNQEIGLKEGSLATDADDIAKHYIKPVDFTTIIIPSEVDNVIGYAICRIDDLEGLVDLSENYLITEEDWGKLRVDKRAIAFATGSKEDFIYNDQDYTFTDHTVSANSPNPIIEGHISTAVNATVVNTYTEISVDNLMNFKITRISDGEDLTEYYIIDVENCEWGKLRVNKRPLVVKASDKNKVYDDQPLFCQGNDYSLMEGTSIVDKLDLTPYSLFVEYTGERIKVGSSACAPILSSIKVYKYQDDISSNYDISLYEGTGEGILTVERRTIAVYTEGGQWVYDDTDHSVDVIKIAQGSPYSLVNPNDDGGEITHTFIRTGELPYVHNVADGIVQNRFTYQIRRTTGDVEEDLTDNYLIISESWGTLEITQRFVSIATFGTDDVYGGNIIYDGQLHDEFKNYVDITQNFASIYPPEEIGLIAGHTYSLTDWTKFMDVTEFSEELQMNNATVTILKGEEDVTDNYTIGFIAGAVIIEQRDIKITSIDGTWVYDGTEHFGEYKIDPNYQGIQGHIINVTSTGITDVQLEDDIIYGIPNILTTIITDSNNGDRDVTHNYDIDYDTVELTSVDEDDFGTLTVLPRSIAFITNGNSWTYDDEYHGDDGFSIGIVEGVTTDNQGLVSGQTVTVQDITEIKDVAYDEDGKVVGVKNILVMVIEGQNGDVTHNYEIDYIYQELKIEPREITITSSAKKTYDDELFVYNQIEVIDGSLAKDSHIVTAQTVHTDTSEGAYINAGVYDNLILEDSVVITANGKAVTKNYKITTELGKLTIDRRQVNYVTNGNSWVYDGQEHSEGTITETSANLDTTGLLASRKHSFVVVGELPTIKTVAQSPVANAFSVGIVNANGDDVSSNYIITRDGVGELSITHRPIYVATDSNNYKIYYNGQPHSVEVYSVIDATQDTGLVVGHSVNNVDFQSFVEAGTYTNAVIVTITDGNEDVTNNYSLMGDYFGSVTVSPRPITILTGSQTWIENGQSHSYPHYEILANDDANLSDADYGLLSDLGHYEEVSNWATITAVGTTPNTVTVVIMDEEGDITSNYAVTVRTGTLTVLARVKIKATLQTISYTYDGMPHSYLNNQFYTSGKPSGWKVTTDLSGVSIINVGEQLDYTNFTDCVFTVYDANGQVVDPELVEVTWNTSSIAKMTIKARTVTLTSLDATKPYDGQPLTNSTVLVSGLVEGHTIEEVHTTGTVTDITQTPVVNTIKYGRIIDADGKDVTANYFINLDEGELTVTLPT